MVGKATRDESVGGRSVRGNARRPHGLLTFVGANLRATESNERVSRHLVKRGKYIMQAENGIIREFPV
jgi:hypothetical protein